MSNAEAFGPAAGEAMAAFDRQDSVLILRIGADSQHIEIALQPSDILGNVARLFPEYGLHWRLPTEDYPGIEGEYTLAAMATPVFGPTLSVAMIVKDEEKCLAECLDSIKGVADEIVIVDTGSIDETVKIARCYTDKVYFHEWEDDFSKARNQSLSYCTGDWILQIDADEELVERDIPILQEGLRRLADRPEIDRVMVALLSEVRGGNVSRSFFPRLFRRDGCHYEGIVHNQLIGSGGSIANLPVRIVHHGYNLPDAEMQKKIARTEGLLRKQLEADPMNAFAWVNLIHSHRNQHKPEFVIANAYRVLENPTATAGNRHTTMGDLMVAYLETKEPEKGISVAYQAITEHPGNADNLWLLAWLHKESGQTAKAIGDLEDFLKTKAREQQQGPEVNAMFNDTFGKEPVAAALLAQWREELAKEPIREAM